MLCKFVWNNCMLCLNLHVLIHYPDLYGLLNCE
uniref:Uncharacterized protein n=1 Tax=Anguilla anguilla TaxID=7936 RepID=A0A0E9THZ1_ANGAN